MLGAMVAEKGSPASERAKRAPEGLSSRSKRLWGAVNADFELAAHELTLLEEALRALDRAAEAREAVDKQGLTVVDRFQQVRPHPLLAVERDARGLFLRCLRELGLDPAQIDDRPPPIEGRYDN